MNVPFSNFAEFVDHHPNSKKMSSCITLLSSMSKPSFVVDSRFFLIGRGPLGKGIAHGFNTFENILQVPDLPSQLDGL